MGPDSIKGSPYFFCKLTINVLVNAAKRNVGAHLEHALANINVLLPAIWGKLRDAERWQVGLAYAEAYAGGKSSAVSGLKSALLKVKGFDYVPESLRSETFIKAAEAVLKAHEGLNNFYNEAAPVSNLAKLGSTIPTPALPLCATALLSVCLGNRYGVAWSAEPDATRLLSQLSQDRWQYYLNQVLPGDVRILSKLSDDRPVVNWIALVARHRLNDLQIKHRTVARLIKAAGDGATPKVKDCAAVLIQEFYGKSKSA